MYAAFVKLLNMSAAASVLIGVVLVLRFLLRKTPKKYICILWGLVALRLVCPFSNSSALSAYNYIAPTRESTGQVEYIHYNGRSEKPKAELTLTIPLESTDGPAAQFVTKDVYIPTFFTIWTVGAAAMLTCSMPRKLISACPLAFGEGAHRGNDACCNGKLGIGYAF